MAGIPLPTSVSTSCHILSIHHLPLDLYKHTLFLFLFLHFDNAFAVPANIYFPLPCHYHSSRPSCAISPSLLFLLPCRHPRLPPHTPSESGTLLLAWMTCTVETAFPAQFSSPSLRRRCRSSVPSGALSLGTQQVSREAQCVDDNENLVVVVTLWSPRHHRSVHLLDIVWRTQ